jgi:glycosyltransferase involved in cell wall biosynthesis
MTDGLSVVLPLYNGAAFVRAAIDSVIKQKNLPQKWEIIVVDDGSSDHGVSICLQLAEQKSQIRVEHHRVNLGVAAARNHGVELARYRYLGFIDQDDHWAPNKWLLQSQALHDSKADYAIGYQLFELQNPESPPHWFRDSWLQKPQKACVFGAILIAKQDFLKVGSLNEKYRYGDDIDWFLRAKEKGLKQEIVDHVVLHRYVHDRNASAYTAQSNLELLQLIRNKLARQG